MALRFEQSFSVKAPAHAVWEYLTDPYRAAAALPGAAVTEKIDEKTFAGTITVKVGPVKTQYKGQARFEEMDHEARTARIVGSGRDIKGRGGADMVMRSSVKDNGDGSTAVEVITDVTVTGILAQFGRGMIQDVSDQLFKKFTEKARQELEQAAGAAPEPAAASTSDAAPAAAADDDALDAVTLGTAVAGSIVKRLVAQPAFWIAAVAVVGLIYWLVR